MNTRCWCFAQGEDIGVQCVILSISEQPTIFSNHAGCIRGILWYANWKLALPFFIYLQKRFSKNRQISQKLCISASKMYLMICVEWVDDHYGVGLILRGMAGWATVWRKLRNLVTKIWLAHELKNYLTFLNLTNTSHFWLIHQCYGRTDGRATGLAYSVLRTVAR